MFAAILLVTATLVLLMVQKCLVLLDRCGDRGKGAPAEPGSSLNQVKDEPEGRHELWRERTGLESDRAGRLISGACLGPQQLEEIRRGRPRCCENGFSEAGKPDRVTAR